MSSQMMLVETLMVALTAFDGGGWADRLILSDLMADVDPDYYDLDIRMLRSSIRLSRCGDMLVCDDMKCDGIDQLMDWLSNEKGFKSESDYENLYTRSWLLSRANWLGRRLCMETDMATLVSRWISDYRSYLDRYPVELRIRYEKYIAIYVFGQEIYSISITRMNERLERTCSDSEYLEFVYLLSEFGLENPLS